MRVVVLWRYALTTVVAALLAGCGVSQPLIGVPPAMPQVAASAVRANHVSYNVVYTFGLPPDARYPTASLIDVSGTLYGTTESGGSVTNYRYGGTVFSVTTRGREKVLHSFGRDGGIHGYYPVANLIDVQGKLYGTTEKTHSYISEGTVFRIVTGRREKVLHYFGSYHGDGRTPLASLIEVKGKLYGTTVRGGDNLNGHHGVVFSIAGGSYNTLYNFGESPDGDSPAASLIAVEGVLYGTTSKGGTDNRGTVFSLTMDGSEKVLHSFGKGADDGHQPVASLFEMNGTLYGTTQLGGTYDRGTAFSLTPSGTEKVLHSFGGGTDGRQPVASLIAVKGTLYGTTQRGGTDDGGTVFSLTPSGTEKVLHNFGKLAYPSASLIDVNGTLYGTTKFGGPYGSGTVFALTP